MFAAFSDHAKLKYSTFILSLYLAAACLTWF